MKQYKNLIMKVLDSGNQSKDRTGTGTIRIFGEQLRFDLSQGFPLITTKKIYWKAVVHELLWFIGGGTNIKELNNNGIHIWDEWADADGELGPVYGYQWRKHPDQLAQVISDIKRNPFSRRLLVDCWDITRISHMGLPPCHFAFQFFCKGCDLSLQVYQRSCDVFLGLPFNIASYALLLTLVANVTDMVPAELVFSLGDTHIYNNHVEQCKTILTRDILPSPTLFVPKRESIDDFVYEDINLFNYVSHPALKGEISI